MDITTTWHHRGLISPAHTRQHYSTKQRILHPPGPPLAQIYIGTSSSVDPGAGKSMRAMRRSATTNEINIGRRSGAALRWTGGIGLSMLFDSRGAVISTVTSPAMCTLVSQFHTQTGRLRACRTVTGPHLPTSSSRTAWRRRKKSPSMLFTTSFKVSSNHVHVRQARARLRSSLLKRHHSSEAAEFLVGW